MKALRQKSEMLTGYLEFMINEKNNGTIEIITPKDINQRGCQLSLRTKKNGRETHNRLNDSGVICDWREPDVIRVAPVPLYNTFEDVFMFVGILFK